MRNNSCHTKNLQTAVKFVYLLSTYEKYILRRQSLTAWTSDCFMIPVTSIPSKLKVGSFTPVAAAVAIISGVKDCTACVNAVKKCINDNKDKKNKVWKTTYCILTVLFHLAKTVSLTLPNWFWRSLAVLFKGCCDFKYYTKRKVVYERM